MENLEKLVINLFIYQIMAMIVIAIYFSEKIKDRLDTQVERIKDRIDRLHK